MISDSKLNTRATHEDIQLESITHHVLERFRRCRKVRREKETSATNRQDDQAEAGGAGEQMAMSDPEQNLKTFFHFITTELPFYLGRADT